MSDHKKINGKALIITAAAGVVLAGSIAAWHYEQKSRLAARNLAELNRHYTTSGFGGYGSSTVPDHAIVPKTPSKPDPVAPLIQAYNGGHYSQAAADAKVIIASTARASTGKRTRPAVTEASAKARWLLAYSEAREHNLVVARADFAALEREAGSLPDKGKLPAEPGEQPSTLQSEAAYEQAVCTAALGDKQGAQRQYLSFLRRYPDSPYIHAAMMRIDRLNGGHTPQVAQAVWQADNKVILQHEHEVRLASSMCGPECLAEIMRRRGTTVDVHRLAKEMHTSMNGTTMEDMAVWANHHGLTANGLALTPKGLKEQKLPMVALVMNGHYVVVDAVTPSKVTFWDPDAAGVGKGAERALDFTTWQRIWSGAVLAM